MEKEKFTKYEKARILGARALQITMDAPLLKDIKKEKLEEINYNPMEIASEELEALVLPITVKKPIPEKKSVKIKKSKVDVDKDSKETAEEEVLEEKEIEEEGEIMELVTPEDEVAEETSEGREASEELQ